MTAWLLKYRLVDMHKSVAACYFTRTALRRQSLPCAAGGTLLVVDCLTCHKLLLLSQVVLPVCVVYFDANVLLCFTSHMCNLWIMSHSIHKLKV